MSPRATSQSEDSPETDSRRLCGKLCFGLGEHTAYAKSNSALGLDFRGKLTCTFLSVSAQLVQSGFEIYRAHRGYACVLPLISDASCVSCLEGDVI